MRLSLIRLQAKRYGQPEVAARSDQLRQKVDAIVVAEDEVSTAAARRELAVLGAAVLTLQAEAGVPEHGLSVFPRWLEFTLWTAPVVFCFGAVALFMALRRRKLKVGEESLAALDASAEEQKH